MPWEPITEQNEPYDAIWEATLPPELRTTHARRGQDDVISTDPLILLFLGTPGGSKGSRRGVGGRGRAGGGPGRGCLDSYLDSCQIAVYMAI